MAPVVVSSVSRTISGLLSIEGIPVEGLLDTRASITCLGFAIWWRYRAQWGALKPFTNAVHGAHGKPLQIAGRTEHLDIQWGEARGRASFVVIIGLESPPCLIGMDIMRPLRVSIDVTAGTATPAQPDPQTIHLNATQDQPRLKKLAASPCSLSSFATKCRCVGSFAASTLGSRPHQPLSQQLRAACLAEAGSTTPSEPASFSTPPPGFPTARVKPTAPSHSAHPHMASCARLLQTADIPPETARLVRCHRPLAI